MSKACYALAFKGQRCVRTANQLVSYQRDDQLREVPMCNYHAEGTEAGEVVETADSGVFKLTRPDGGITRFREDWGDDEEEEEDG